MGIIPPPPVPQEGWGPGGNPWKKPDPNKITEQELVEGKRSLGFGCWKHDFTAACFRRVPNYGAWVSVAGFVALCLCSWFFTTQANNSP